MLKINPGGRQPLTTTWLTGSLSFDTRVEDFQFWILLAVDDKDAVEIFFLTLQIWNRTIINQWQHHPRMLAKWHNRMISSHHRAVFPTWEKNYMNLVFLLKEKLFSCFILFSLFYCECVLMHLFHSILSTTKMTIIASAVYTLNSMSVLFRITNTMKKILYSTFIIEHHSRRKFVAFHCVQTYHD